jgi:hypothetical protein
LPISDRSFTSLTTNTGGIAQNAARASSGGSGVGIDDSNAMMDGISTADTVDDATMSVVNTESAEGHCSEICNRLHYAEE